MPLLDLEARDFRCLGNVQLELDRRCTFIVGENGSGKTSLLEAVHVLSCGHSFRSNQQELLIRQGAQEFLVVGHVERRDRPIVIGVRGSSDHTEAHMGGKRAQGFAELAELLPTQVIDPEVHRLLEDGPRMRRRFMDWGLFHVEPQFVADWRRYQKALRQRNAALKAKLSGAQVSAWDSELIVAGSAIAAQRQEYVSGLGLIISEIAETLLGLPVHIQHKQGWTQDCSLELALSNARSRDQRYSLTTVGPHRADLAVSVDGMPAKERISRGQQKLLASAMLLAQIVYRMTTSTEPVLLLLDDPAAELDVDNLEKLLKEIAKIPAQLVVTSLDRRLIDRYLSGAVFHVKQGHITPML